MCIFAGSSAVTTMARYLRRLWRASLQPGSLLTLEEAAEALPGQPRDALAWLVEHVEPVGEVGDEVVYRWGAVVSALSTPHVPEQADRGSMNGGGLPGANGADAEVLLSTKAAARFLRVRPATLFALADRALEDGVAVPTGEGSERRHLRWQPDRVEAWWRGLRAS